VRADRILGNQGNKRIRFDCLFSSLFFSQPASTHPHVNQSTMPYAKCPYCPLVSTTPGAQSAINRHIRTEALKPADERKRHPAKGSYQFELVEQERNFRTKAATEEERNQKTAERKAKYSAKRKIIDENKVEDAYHTLQ
jgi:hypothetical protein